VKISIDYKGFGLTKAKKGTIIFDMRIATKNNNIYRGSIHNQHTGKCLYYFTWDKSKYRVPQIKGAKKVINEKTKGPSDEECAYLELTAMMINEYIRLTTKTDFDDDPFYASNNLSRRYSLYRSYGRYNRFKLKNREGKCTPVHKKEIAEEKRFKQSSVCNRSELKTPLWYKIYFKMWVWIECIRMTSHWRRTRLAPDKAEIGERINKEVIRPYCNWCQYTGDQCKSPCIDISDLVGSLPQITKKG